MGSERRGQTLGRKRFSSGINPIEMAFAKLKALLRKAAKRTVPALTRQIGRAIGEFSARECRNFIREAGYIRR